MESLRLWPVVLKNLHGHCREVNNPVLWGSRAGCRVQHSGRRFLAIITGLDPRVSKSNRLHDDILRFSFYEIGVYSTDSSKTINNFPAVLMNFNRLFLKLNRFICNILPVLPDHRVQRLHGSARVSAYIAVQQMATALSSPCTPREYICSLLKLLRDWRILRKVLL
jgi:hypothetical protein